MFLFDMLALPEEVVVYLIIEPALARAGWGFQALFGLFWASRGYACMMYVSLAHGEISRAQGKHTDKY